MLLRMHRCYSRKVLTSLPLKSILFIIEDPFHLLGMEKTMQEYEDWTTEPIPDSLDKSYKKALAKLENCLPFEDALVRRTFWHFHNLTSLRFYLRYKLLEVNASSTLLISSFENLGSACAPSLSFKKDFLDQNWGRMATIINNRDEITFYLTEIFFILQFSEKMCISR